MDRCFEKYGGGHAIVFDMCGSIRDQVEDFQIASGLGEGGLFYGTGLDQNITYKFMDSFVSWNTSP